MYEKDIGLLIVSFQIYPTEGPNFKTKREKHPPSYVSNLALSTKKRGKKRMNVVSNPARRTKY